MQSLILLLHLGKKTQFLLAVSCFWFRPQFLFFTFGVGSASFLTSAKHLEPVTLVGYSLKNMMNKQQCWTYLRLRWTSSITRQVRGPCWSSRLFRQSPSDSELQFANEPSHRMISRSQNMRCCKPTTLGVFWFLYALESNRMISGLQLRMLLYSPR